MMKLTCWLFIMLLLAGACHSPKALLHRVDVRFEQANGKMYKVMPGVYWYSWQGYDTILKRNESLNIIDINLRRAKVKVDFKWFNTPETRNVISYIADTSLAIAAVNSGYFEYLNDGGYITFHKSRGQIDQTVQIPPTHTRYWKHQGAFIQKAPGQFAIVQGDQNLYTQLPYPDIVSSAPLLITNGVPVGKYFVKQKSGDKSHLESEHPERHQAGNGPRMAYGLTAHQHLLLVAVDGRGTQAGGINAEELTDLMQGQLGATEAINLDGGGSTTMWVRGATPTGVVNYPSDLRKTNAERFAHAGQRKVGMGLFIIPTQERVKKRIRKLPVAPDTEAKDYIDNP